MPVRWLLHSPSRISIKPATLTASHTDSEAGLSAVTRLFCNDATELSVTDQFAVAPAEPAPNQWHMTARITGKAKTRIAAVIQVMPAGTSPKTVYHYGDRLVIGSWTITPQLDASQPAALKVSHSNDAVCFSYGSDNPKLNGTEYQRKYGQSSLLYDNIGGTYQVEEQTDRLPASTRVK